MEKTESQPAAATPEPEKKHNLGAKIGVAVALGTVVGGKLAMPGMLLDINNLFPKGTPIGTKLKQTFSKEIIPLALKAVELQKAKGHGPMMAGLIAMKWSTLISTATGIGLGVIGWKGADRIHDSKDIYKHPITSTKIILGLQEPDAASAKAESDIKGKYTAAVTAERDVQPEITSLR